MRVYEAQKQYIRWLIATRDLSPNTIRAYEGDVAAFKRHLGGHTCVTQIDHESLVGFVDEQRSIGLSPPSVRRRVAAVRGFCRWLRGGGFLDSDPLVGLTMPTGRPRTLPRVVPPHELTRLFAYLQQAAAINDTPTPNAIRAQPHSCTTLLGVALMVATGMRVNEVTGVNCDDIDLHSRSIKVLGKGRRERRVFLTNSWLTELTGIYMQVRDELSLAHTRFLFNLVYNPLTAQAMRSRLSKTACAAGLRGHVTPHMLRHTAATQLIEAGVDIRYIQRLLGHVSLATTELYTHVSDTSLRRVVTDANVLEKCCGYH